MSAARKFEKNESKLLIPKQKYRRQVNILLQKLGDRWYAFFELNGEIYYQIR